jgi:hypothetical protein
VAAVWYDDWLESVATADAGGTALAPMVVVGSGGATVAEEVDPDSSVCRESAVVRESVVPEPTPSSSESVSQRSASLLFGARGRTRTRTDRRRVPARTSCSLLPPSSSFVVVRTRGCSRSFLAGESRLIDGAAFRSAVDPRDVFFARATPWW